MSSKLSAAVTTTKNRKGGRVLEYGPDVAYLLFNIWYPSSDKDETRVGAAVALMKVCFALVSCCFLALHQERVTEQLETTSGTALVVLAAAGMLHVPCACQQWLHAGRFTSEQPEQAYTELQSHPSSTPRVPEEEAPKAAGEPLPAEKTPATLVPAAKAKA